MVLTGTSRSHDVMHSKSWGFLEAEAATHDQSVEAADGGLILTRGLGVVDEQLHHLACIVIEQLCRALRELFFLS